jgi:hypothetical protein
MTNWIKHLKKVRKQHPKMAYKKVQKMASKTYKPSSTKSKKTPFIQFFVVKTSTSKP